MSRRRCCARVHLRQGGKDPSLGRGLGGGGFWGAQGDEEGGGPGAAGEGGWRNREGGDEISAQLGVLAGCSRCSTVHTARWGTQQGRAGVVMRDTPQQVAGAWQLLLFQCRARLRRCGGMHEGAALHTCAVAKL